MSADPFHHQHQVGSYPFAGCPTISVVIAVRDDERTIQRAILSALKQSSAASEVIVVDDMSTDTTKQRVLELKSERVVVVDGEGRGTSAARNAGIRRASGAWIAFLDGDDYWQPEFLDLAQRRIRSSPDAVACFGAATPIDEEGRVVGRGEMPEVVTMRALVSGQIGCSTSATLVRRAAVAECGGFFEGLKRAVEDVDLWLRLAALGPCIGFPRAASLYEVHEERDRAKSVDLLAGIEHDYELLIDRFAANGAPPSLVRRGRAITRARIARHWLRAEKPAYALPRALSSLRTLPTREGFVALALASMPPMPRETIVRSMRSYRARRPHRAV
jgi:glycosyltransferase involved in cell wall biosynthesis